MYARFGLVLTVNHACNLRCMYCYTGAKFNRPMPVEIGRKAIDRAAASLSRGGTLELGFFGGEPLLEPGRIAEFVRHARARTEAAALHLDLSMTTNGTILTPAAHGLMALPEMHVAVSHDGLPEVHDRHRPFADGRGSSAAVLRTIEWLVEAGEDFRVVMVVHPDAVPFLPDGIRFLRGVGVRHVDPALDLWARWRPADACRLVEAIECCANLWREGLPEHSITWFDEKAAFLTGVPIAPTARCSFGAGEIAVAPSGRLYPCERLIGEDAETNPSRLPGHVLDGADFLGFRPAPCRHSPACDQCSIRAVCSTTCRCSNFIRTGDVTKPDGLLCLLNRVCARETTRALKQLGAAAGAAAG